MKHDDAWLPRGVSPNRREPVGRVIAVVIIAIVLAGAVGSAALYLARRPPTRAVVASSTSESTPELTVPMPSTVQPSAKDRRTIDAAGPNTIPDNLTLPHENDPNWIGTNLRVDACPNSTPESQNLADATDVRTIALTDGDEIRSETLAIGANDGAASGIYDDFVSAMQQCENFATATTSDAPSVASPSPSSTTATVKPLKDDGKHLQTGWTRSTLLMLKFPGLDSETQSSASYLLIAQAGRAVVIGAAIGVSAAGDGMDSSVARSLQAFADAMAPKVCIFKEGGCAPPTVGQGGVQFPPGSVILPDGNVMLPNGTIVDPTGAPVPTQSSTPSRTQPVAPSTTQTSVPVPTGGFG